MNEKEQHRKIGLPDKQFSMAQLAVSLNVLAKQHRTTLATLIRKLDRVSGNVKHLQLLLAGNTKYEWTPQEDELLQTNQGLLIRWKGVDCVKLRKEYLKWSKETK